MEHGVEMRFYISFEADGENWTRTEVRTYDGRDSGEWVTIDSQVARRKAAGRGLVNFELEL